MCGDTGAPGEGVVKMLGEGVVLGQCLHSEVDQSEDVSNQWGHKLGPPREPLGGEFGMEPRRRMGQEGKERVHLVCADMSEYLQTAPMARLQQERSHAVKRGWGGRQGNLNWEGAGGCASRVDLAQSGL